MMNGDPDLADTHRQGALYADHPDPSWARRSWIPLDGTWDFSRLPRGWKYRGLGTGENSSADIRPGNDRGATSENHDARERCEHHTEKIQVPFPVGSELSGVKSKDRGCWSYSRSFTLPDKPDSRWILHVGACDYEARVYVNGLALSGHRGGYSSFSVDISDACKVGDNSLEIVVRDSRSPFQLRGKQSFLPVPFLVWYSGCSGIWQSVWIEETGGSRLAGARLDQDFALSRVRGRAWLDSGTWNAESGLGGRRDDARRAAGSRLCLEIILRSPDGSATRLRAAGPDREGVFSFEFGFDAVGGALWSPENPVLHPIIYRLLRGSEVLDQVESYFGLRKIGLREGDFLLNDRPLLLRLVLIQGYYPGGSYAAPDKALMEQDILAAKAMGFNGARIHQKVESPYFQYLCDKLGFLTSCEMPSFYLPSRRAFGDYEAELRSIIARDMAHPSCVLRILFNETWGIWGIYRRGSKTRRFVLGMTALARALDPTRPVIDNSGWEHLGGDILDIHHYLKNPSLARALYEALKRRDPAVLQDFSIPKVLAFNLFYQVAAKTRSLFLDRDARIDGRPLLLSEYGGFGWYRSEGNAEATELIGEYTKDALDSGLFCGYCYTQLYDVGSETNGLLAADRKPKVDMGAMREINGYEPDSDK